MRKTLFAFVWLGLVSLGGPTLAWAPVPESGWRGPSLEEQRAGVVAPPAGQGALLVPVMTTPEAEPPVEVWQGEKLVTRGRTGEAVPLAPGAYEVRLRASSGEGLRRTVTVVADEVTVLPPDWAALVVHVVDRNRVPHRGTYELVSVGGGRAVGVGYGAEPERGQRLATWLVEPGEYLLLRRGQSLLPREDFFSLRVRSGYVEEVVLVVDPDDGSFRGAGALDAIGGLGTEIDEELTIRWIVGAGVSLDFRRGVPGSADTTELGLSGFTEFVLSFIPDPHLVYLRAKIDEEFSEEDWGPFEKELDLLRIDSLYAFRVLPWLGPYVRVGIESSFFPSYARVDDAGDFVLADAPTTILHHGDHFRVADSLFPLTLKSGVGLRWEAEWAPIIDVWALSGVGLRQVFNHDVFEAIDDPQTAAFELRRRGDSLNLGPELAVVLEVTPARWLTISADLELFAPFEAVEDPTVRFETEVVLRMTSLLALVYSLRVQRQPAVSGRLQHTHRVALEISYNVF